MVGHRESLARGLFEGCKHEESIKFHFSTTVEKVECFSTRPSLTAFCRSDGTTRLVEADVVLASDGVKSNVRSQLLQKVNAEV